jgi:hypothetical protein
VGFGDGAAQDAGGNDEIVLGREDRGVKEEDFRGEGGGGEGGHAAPSAAYLATHVDGTSCYPVR